jgi:hypothetical protein
MDDNKKGREVLERAKSRKLTEPRAKEQSEAERLFYLIFPEALHWKADYSQPLAAFDPITYVPYLKETALAILGTGIIGESGLKGHAGHGETFPVDLRDLIGALVDTHFKYTEIIFSPEDILTHFDNRFEGVAAFARLAGVKDLGERGIKKVREEWRGKVYLAVSQGKFPPNWRELTKVQIISSYKYRPKSEAQALANVFLTFVPQAKADRIVTWVKKTLESLGGPPVGRTSLNDYISKRKLRYRR